MLELAIDAGGTPTDQIITPNSNTLAPPMRVAMYPAGICVAA